MFGAFRPRSKKGDRTGNRGCFVHGRRLVVRRFPLTTLADFDTFSFFLLLFNFPAAGPFRAGDPESAPPLKFQEEVCNSITVLVARAEGRRLDEGLRRRWFASNKRRGKIRFL